MKIRIKEVKNFNKEEDVLVLPPYVEVDESIKVIRIPSFAGMAVIKSKGSYTVSVDKAKDAGSTVVGWLTAGEWDYESF